MNRPMTEIERQQDYLRKIGDSPATCPNCNKLANWWEVSGIKRENYTGHEVNLEGPCPHCGVALAQVVPFQGPTYMWVKKDTVAPPAAK